MQKLILCICGPSGAGKSTLIKYLISNYSDKFQKFPTVTDRSLREGEKQGDPYIFLTLKEFDKKIQDNDLLEWEFQSHNNCRYGKSYSVLKDLPENKIIITELQIFKVEEFRNNLNDYKIISIFIDVDSTDTLLQRIMNRGETLEVAKHRLEESIEEGEKNKELADYIVPSVSGHIEVSADKLLEIISNL